MDSFASRLTNLREGRNWSKTDAAKQLGIPRTTYYNYEYGKREPDFDTLKKIAALYHVSIDYLLGKNNKAKSTDLAEMLDAAESFDGKPMTAHDREIIKAYLEGRFNK